ncbi:S41 family peptidase [Flavobacterium gelatinilyticum]|uniref:S41 family peptidase n=1 Tax=Flavobacterium gelatinilyticum TaxID=3003260 RepID=UPI002480C4DD|nr:S41 family peptidase [Flavobacterium gelatinilyticum]
MKYSFRIRILIPLLCLFALISCEEDNTENTYDEGSNEYVNDWMYNQMKRYYFWNTSISDKGNLSLQPKEYFKSLLRSGDIYSYAMHPEQPETSPKSMRSKFGFDVSFISFEGKYYGVVLYALEDSPAKRNGLERGNIITKINGTEVSQNNYNQLYENMIATAQIDLEIKSYTENDGFSNPKEVSIQQGFTFSQPIKYQVIEKNNVKTGYIEIPHFDVGQAQLFAQIFQKLKSKSITELVVDLRYNGGGDISSAAALSIVLAPNIKSNNLFIKFEGNANGGKVDQSFAQALESNETKVNFNVLQNVHPNINRVYILCGGRTASASELIINNLSPYMPVITIGEKTFGKDVASFPVEDNRIPDKRGWILYPAIYKLFNAKSEGNYSDGINPEVSVTEIQNPEIFPLGSTSETLLNTALNAITGNTSKIKKSTIKTMPLRTAVIEADPLLYRNIQ